MDKLKIVMTKLSERQLNYLLNDKRNQKPSPFINTAMLGLNFGLQGMRFQVTSTPAENQSYPMYWHSIPNNNDNQDIVSMGCNAALLTSKVIHKGFDVLSVQWLALMQAIDHLQCHNRLSSCMLKVYHKVRAISDVIKEDTLRYKELESITKYLLQLGATTEI